jgi:putative oxidoreductase
MAAGAAETAGGALLSLGALTPVAGTLITGTMLTAIRKVHAPNGVWNADGGYEYNLALIAAVTTLVECGPGSPSLDRALGIETSGSA